MNLVDFGFQDSNLFRHMPRFDEISYLGHKEEKVRLYKAVREGQSCEFLVLNFIREEEKVFWGAVEDFVKRSTIDAAAGASGVYMFDLLTIEIHKEVKTFSHAELTTLIKNEAARLSLGKMSMIKYSSLYALLLKKIDSDWGKVTFTTSVDVFKDKPEYLDLLIRMLLRDYMFPRDPVVLLLNDLSLNPVFNPANEKQQARLKSAISDLIPVSVEFIPEVYIQDKNGARELLSGSKL